MTGVTAFAPAKINLYLHVTGRRSDGYHLIDSLVAFADIGDHVTARPSGALSLKVTGPEAASLEGLGNANLVLRAAHLLAEFGGVTPAAAVHLEKNLPVAAGIGGGSSDAAATLRALSALWRLPVDLTALARLGRRIGADVAACVHARAAWVDGIGERIEPAPGFPDAGIVLVNPRRSLSTAAVFKARSGPFGKAGERFAPMPANAAELAAALAPRRNDLTAAALTLVPEIAEVLIKLQRLPGALLARMSGSGATCFGLFTDHVAAERARAALTAAEPGWWSASGSLVAANAVCR